jgi:hypothetical protein
MGRFPRRTSGKQRKTLYVAISGDFNARLGRISLN